MRMTLKQLRIYAQLGCRTMSDVRACKRMIHQIIKEK